MLYKISLSNRTMTQSKSSKIEQMMKDASLPNEYRNKIRDYLKDNKESYGFIIKFLDSLAKVNDAEADLFEDIPT